MADWVYDDWDYSAFGGGVVRVELFFGEGGVEFRTRRESGDFRQGPEHECARHERFQYGFITDTDDERRQPSTNGHHHDVVDDDSGAAVLCDFGTDGNSDRSGYELDYLGGSSGDYGFGRDDYGISGAEV